MGVIRDILFKEIVGWAAVKTYEAVSDGIKSAADKPKITEEEKREIERKQRLADQAAREAEELREKLRVAITVLCIAGLLFMFVFKAEALGGLCIIAMIALWVWRIMLRWGLYTIES